MHDSHQNLKPENTHRLFLALLPDPQTVNRLTKLQEGIEGRKTPRGNLHLTLMFLGSQPESRIPELATFIDSLAFQAFDLCIDRRGFFSRLKISWAGIKEPPPMLAKLHQAIWDYCRRNSILEYDMKRPFRPHITLARNAKPTGTPIPEPFIWHVTRLALMESIISHERGRPAIYKVLHEKRA
ncbi:MAG: RNA 2',3'-cyclic phosphodiesterase [Oxalobacter sp.]|nr:RNA 2',3'-cyclic phosphodiesterase [Oxalobacter sp.]